MLTEDDLRGLMAGIGPVIKQYVQEQIALATAQSLSYAGVWSEGKGYQRNQLVTHASGLWVALDENFDVRPGQSDAWKLVAKPDESRLRKLIKQELEGRS
jgi:hypothetical protein